MRNGKGDIQLILPNTRLKGLGRVAGQTAEDGVCWSARHRVLEAPRSIQILRLEESGEAAIGAVDDTALVGLEEVAPVA